MAQEKKHLLLTNLQNNKPIWSFMVIMDFAVKLSGDNLFADTDTALEWAEDSLLNKEQPQTGVLSEFDITKVSLFDNFTKDELIAIQEKVIHQVYSKGETVFSEGDNSRDLYVLTKGLMTVTIYLPERDRYKRVFTYSSGVVFGEMSFLDGSPRSADVLAHEEAEVFCLRYDDFELLCKQNFKIANKLLKNIALEISHRLRRTSNQVRELEDN
jgi:CRP-like cAMP-binding protein